MDEIVERVKLKLDPLRSISHLILFAFRPQSSQSSFVHGYARDWTQIVLFSDWVQFDTLTLRTQFFANIKKKWRERTKVGYQKQLGVDRFS